MTKRGFYGGLDDVDRLCTAAKPPKMLGASDADMELPPVLHSHLLTSLRHLLHPILVRSEALPSRIPATRVILEVHTTRAQRLLRNSEVMPQQDCWYANGCTIHTAWCAPDVGCCEFG